MFRSARRCLFACLATAVVAGLPVGATAQARTDPATDRQTSVKPLPPNGNAHTAGGVAMPDRAGLSHAPATLLAHELGLRLFHGHRDRLDLNGDGRSTSTPRLTRPVLEHA